MDDKIIKLKNFLSNLQPGPIPNHLRAELVQLLENNWELFEGCDQQKMNAGNLVRLEDPEWYPPILNFVIERHGGTVLGSTRADKQQWKVGMDNMDVKCEKIGYRQLETKQSRFDISLIANELARLILTGKKDKRLKWASDGSVQIQSSLILPGASKQTTEGRRRRLKKALEERLAIHGWQLHGSWWRLDKK